MRGLLGDYAWKGTKILNWPLLEEVDTFKLQVLVLALVVEIRCLGAYGNRGREKDYHTTHMLRHS